MLALSVSYNWWKLFHVLGVLAFVMFHGVSVSAALRLRKERDRSRIAEILQLSGSSVKAMYASLAWLIVFGVIAGWKGQYLRAGWLWASVGILVVVTGEMSAVGKPFYRRVKEAVELRPSGVPRKSDEELDAILRSPITTLNMAIGFSGLVVIAYLMIFKPF
jgi:hypothetical protein